MPYHTLFEDSYCSRQGGWQEKRHVFFEANDLPNRWSNRPSFHIGELGFGFGLNLLLAQYFLKLVPCAELHFWSCDLKLPEPSEYLKVWQWFQTSGAPIDLTWAERLLPILGKKGSKKSIPVGSSLLHLHLFQVEVLEALYNYPNSIDVWFLDGFSPAKNPDMWRIDVFRALTSHSGKQTTLSTYSVAKMVRKHLEETGFQFIRKPGFGRKREMLWAKFDPLA